MDVDAVAPLEGAAASLVHVPTGQGMARAIVHVPAGRLRGRLLLGHGAGGGSGASTPDLLAVGEEAVACGWVVALVDQPWVVAGRRVAVAPPRLDLAWGVVVEHLRDEVPAVDDGTPLVLGGRSAGARVACRTAQALRADGVLCLAFPLHPPGRPGTSRAAELPRQLPVLVLQGERDRFGGPADVAAVAGPAVEVVGVRGDHALRSGTDALRAAVRPWLRGVEGVTTT